MSERLVIEIDGNASGLTKALADADKRLNNFNSHVANGSKALTGFVRNLNSVGNSVNRLNAATGALRTTLNTLNKSFVTVDKSLTKFGNQARSSANDLRAFSTQLTGAGRRLDGLGANARGAGNQLTSLNRRAAALGATISTLNTQLRGLARTAGSAGSAMSGAGAGAGRAAAGVTAAGNAANRATGAFARLGRHNEQLLEGFRRSVAQLTAFRTLAYQGLFWFSPLIYSIIKVNAAYEKQMVLLKNISKATTESGKAQDAVQTRNKLIQFAETNPFSMEHITDAFVKMRVGGTEPLNGSLQTLMDSIAGFGGDNNALQRAAVAIQQMGGKGVISMEELRQQLGEHIPDATQSMAAGMGMALNKLYKQIEQGNVESTTALAKMFAVLRNRHIDDARQMMNTWSGLMARMSTAWQKFVTKITTSQGANSFIETLKKNVQELINFLNTPAGVNFGIEVQRGMATLVDGFVKLIKIAYEYRDTIIMLAKALTVYFGGRLMIGIILGVARAWMMLQTGVVRAGRAMVAILMAITGRTTAAAAAQLIFGANVRRAAQAMGVFNAAGRLSIAGLGMMALRFAGAAAAAMLLVGAIWAVVSALNAKNNAEGKAQALKARAMEGGTWENTEEQAKERNRIMKMKDTLHKGYHYESQVDHLGNATTVKVENSRDYQEKLQAQINASVGGYNQMTMNTTRARTASQTDVHRQNFEQGWTDRKSQLSLDYENKASGVTDPTKRLDLEKSTTQSRIDAANQDITRLEGALKKTKDPNERNALLGLLQERRQDVATDTAGLQALNADNKFVDGGKDDKKKTGGKSREQSALEAAQNKFINESVRTEELEHELKNLKEGTDSEFDNEAATQRATQEARGKTIDQLEVMIRTERRLRDELKKTLEVEKAIVDINSHTAESMFEYQRGVEDLVRGYDSLIAEGENYRKTLERQYQQEIITAKARMESGEATEEEIDQYNRLTNAINEAVRAKELEVLLDYAKEADEHNRSYKYDRMSRAEQIAYDFDLEQKKLDEAMTIATSRRDEALEVDRGHQEKYTKLMEEYAQARSDAEREAIQATIDDLIVVRGERQKEVTDAQALIPILQERQRILDQERRLKEAGPIAEWADTAARGLDNIKDSFQNLVVEGLDGLINGLMEGKMAFGDFVKGVLKGLVQIILKGLIAKTILTALGLPGGMEGGFSLGNLFGGGTSTGGGHGGMVAGGQARFHRTVDPANFAFAKRYHTGGIVGLGQNEVPIIAERGEGVFTEEQMKALGQSSKGSNVQVNVINQTGTEATIERSPPRFDGEKWVEEIVLKKLSRPGPLRDAVGSLGKR